MKNIVFLDIDGVVNTLVIGSQPFDSRMGKIKREDGYYYDLCSSSDLRVSNKQAILWLNKICLESHANIVISSTWRYDYQDTIKSLYNSGLNHKIKIVGRTPRLKSAIRGEEILAYVRKNRVKKYVILDDDCDMNGCLDHLVQTQTYVGLTFNEYLKAKKILN